MVIAVEDALHYVEDLKKEGSSGNYRINWSQKGFTDNGFIVISGQNKQDVLIKSNELLQKKLEHINCTLLKNRVVNSDEITFYYLTFADLKRNGGLNIKEKPGCYAVYGCVVENDNISTVYYSDVNEKFVNISVEIEIIQEDYYIETKKFLGLFSKNNHIYSGYKKITIERGIKGMIPNSVKYHTPDNQAISVPQEVLEHGGIFFVRSEQNEQIRFIASNYGVNIK